STTGEASLTGSVDILRGKGDGTFGQHVSTPLQLDALYAAWITAEAADLNGDGHTDLVLGINAYMGEVAASVLLSSGLRAAGDGPIGQRTYTYDPTFNVPTSTTD